MTQSNDPNPSCWLLSPPHAGMAVQCLALAEAMGIEGERRYVQPRWLWKRLPLAWWGPIGGGFGAVGAGSDRIAPPWPDLVIGCGRYAAGVAMAIRQASREQPGDAGARAAGQDRDETGTRVVQIQDPRVAPDHFDLVIVPEHDRLRGANVLRMQGSLHRVTERRLKVEAARFAPDVAHLPRPLAAVLIGGPNRVYRLGPAEAERIARQLVAMARREGASLAVTVSRRTGPDAAAAFRRIVEQSDVPAVLWDGTGENPYFGYLGLADYLLVTCDSVNMTCEASATGRPVYTIDLPSKRTAIGGVRKFKRFHEQMRQQNRTRPFEGRLDPYEPNPLRETEQVAAEVRGRLGLT